MIKVESLSALGNSSQSHISIKNQSSCGAGYALQNGSTPFWSSVAANPTTLALYQQQQQQHHQRQYDQVSSMLSDDDESIVSLTTDTSSQSSNCSTPPEQPIVMNVDESLPSVNFDIPNHHGICQRVYNSKLATLCDTSSYLCDKRTNETTILKCMHTFEGHDVNGLIEQKDTKTCLDEDSKLQHPHLSSGAISWELSSGSDNSMNGYVRRTKTLDPLSNNVKISDGSKASKRVKMTIRKSTELSNSNTQYSLAYSCALSSPISDCSPEMVQSIFKKPSMCIQPPQCLLPSLPVLQPQQRKRRLSSGISLNGNELNYQGGNTRPRIFASARGKISPRILPCNARDSEQGSEFSILNIIPTLISEKHRKAAFVENLVDTSALILEVIWCNFHINPAAKIIPLRLFLQETLRRSKTSYSTLQTALFYLIRIKSQICSRAFKTSGKNDYPPTPTSEVPHRRENNDPATCGRRMFLAALIVASKFLQDRNYSNKAWSKISGLPVEEINQNEMVFLKLIDYNLFIAEDIFKKWSSLLLTHIQAISGSSIDNAGSFRQVENQREVERFREALRTMDPATMEYNRSGNGNYARGYPITPDISAPASPREEHDQSDRGLSLSMDIDQTSKISDHVMSRMQKRA